MAHRIEPSSLLSIPQEIRQAILDCLDKETLDKIGLVCHTLRREADEKLFANPGLGFFTRVYLRSAGQTDGEKKAMELFEKLPKEWQDDIKKRIWEEGGSQSIDNGDWAKRAMEENIFRRCASKAILAITQTNEKLLALQPLEKLISSKNSTEDQRRQALTKLKRVKTGGNDLMTMLTSLVSKDFLGGKDDPEFGFNAIVNTPFNEEVSKGLKRMKNCIYHHYSKNFLQTQNMFITHSSTTAAQSSDGQKPFLINKVVLETELKGFIAYCEDPNNSEKILDRFEMLSNLAKTIVRYSARSENNIISQFETLSRYLGLQTNEPRLTRDAIVAATRKIKPNLNAYELISDKAVMTPDGSHLPAQ